MEQNQAKQARENKGPDMQSIHIPQTGETMMAHTYSGKELLFNDPNMTDDEYDKLWEDDRL